MCYPDLDISTKEDHCPNINNCNMIVDVRTTACIFTTTCWIFRYLGHFMHNRQRQLCHYFLCKSKPVLDMSENAAKVVNDTQRNSLWLGFVCLPTGEMPSLSAESAISGNTMDGLIQQPSGSGEINMIRMTLPVIAAVYLDKTNQWELIGFEKRSKALEHIETGG